MFLLYCVAQGDMGPIGLLGPPGNTGEKVSFCFHFCIFMLKSHPLESSGMFAGMSRLTIFELCSASLGIRHHLKCKIMFY